MPAAYAVSSIQASDKAGSFCLRRSLFSFENGAAAHDEIAFVVAFADESRLFDPGLYATGLHSAQIVDLHVVGIIGPLFRRSQQTAREFIALETIGDAPSFDARPRCAISLRPIAFPLLAPTALAADLVKRKGEPLGLFPLELISQIRFEPAAVEAVQPAGRDAVFLIHVRHSR